jgi:HAD-superfamily hydrolase, subfamily IIB
MAFHAVFCDIDGTLLDNRHQVRPRTRDKILSLHKSGTPFILVSARNPEGVYCVQDEVGIQAPVVCYGGALVLDVEKKPVRSIGFGMLKAIALKKRIASAWKGVTVTVYSYDHWFVDDLEDPRVVTEAGITGAVPTEIDAESLATHPEDAHKMLCIGDPADILAMEESLCDEYPDLVMIKSSPIFLEVMNSQVNKSGALKYLCQAMRISPAEVVAFGDNYNDMDMLESAGMGIAMGNAPNAVKKIADRTTLDNDSEGVSEALDSLQFKPMTNSIRFIRR